MLHPRWLTTCLQTQDSEILKRKTLGARSYPTVHGGKKERQHSLSRNINCSLIPYPPNFAFKYLQLKFYIFGARDRQQHICLIVIVQCLVNFVHVSVNLKCDLNWKRLLVLIFAKCTHQNSESHPFGPNRPTANRKVWLLRWTGYTLWALIQMYQQPREVINITQWYSRHRISPLKFLFPHTNTHVR
jgi:hypothetical protein